MRDSMAVGAKTNKVIYRINDWARGFADWIEMVNIDNIIIFGNLLAEKADLASKIAQ